MCVYKLGRRPVCARLRRVRLCVYQHDCLVALCMFVSRLWAAVSSHPVWGKSQLICLLLSPVWSLCLLSRELVCNLWHADDGTILTKAHTWQVFTEFECIRSPHTHSQSLTYSQINTYRSLQRLFVCYFCLIYCESWNGFGLCGKAEHNVFISHASKHLCPGRPPWLEHHPRGKEPAEKCQKTNCSACTDSLRHLSVCLFLRAPKEHLVSKVQSYLPPFILSSGSPCFLMTLTLLLHFFEKFNPAPLAHCQLVSGCDNWSPSSLEMVFVPFCSLPFWGHYSLHLPYFRIP